VIIKTMKRQSGFTVVELMIVIVLIGLVLAIGYMYFDFGVKAFDRGERQTIAQKAARITSDFITSELRFAKEIIINPEGGFEEGYRYFYLTDGSGNYKDGSIVFRDEEGSERVLADSRDRDMPYWIYFFSNIPYDVVIFYIIADLNIEPDPEELSEEYIEEIKEEGLYALKTRVQAVNLKLFRDTHPDYEEMITINEGGNNTVIKYKKP